MLEGEQEEDEEGNTDDHLFCGKGHTQSHTFVKWGEQCLRLLVTLPPCCVLGSKSGELSDPQSLYL